MRTAAVRFDNAPMLFDCGDFLICLHHVGMVPGDQPFHVNAHKHDFFEVHFIDEGEGFNKSDLSGTEDYFRSGTLYLAKPGEVHEHYSLAQSPFTLYFIGFDILQKDNPLPGGAEMRSLLLNSHATNSRAFSLKSVFLLIMHEITHNSNGRRWMLQGLLLQLITEISRDRLHNDCKGIPLLTLENHAAMQESIQYLCSHSDMKISLQELAAHARLSVSHYRRMFHKFTGKTVGGYLKDHKMDLASELLRAGCSVKDVAYRLGYKSPEHFSRVFKKTIGCSPSQM